MDKNECHLLEVTIVSGFQIVVISSNKPVLRVSDHIRAKRCAIDCLQPQLAPETPTSFDLVLGNNTGCRQSAMEACR